MVPLHTWLPDAHVEAPTAGSVVLAGVLLKMGTYGFVRFAMPLFPVGRRGRVRAADLALSLVGIVYGALVAMVQTDIKKLVAYSSVAHLGFVMLGMFALNAPGLWQGSVLQMVNHGLSTGALFLLVGMLYERRHTREISDFGGSRSRCRSSPSSSASSPCRASACPLNGFVGEFLILVGAFLASPMVALVIAASGVVLAAAYMLWMYRRVMFGRRRERGEPRPDRPRGWRERGVMVAMAIVPIVWIGVYPEPFLRRIEPSVSSSCSTTMSRAAEPPEADRGAGRQPTARAGACRVAGPPRRASRGRP